MCCVDVDRRPKFCFVEYDTHAAAQFAVDAENGRDFKGAKLSINTFRLLLHLLATEAGKDGKQKFLWLFMSLFINLHTSKNYKTCYTYAVLLFMLSINP